MDSSWEFQLRNSAANQEANPVNTKLGHLPRLISLCKLTQHQTKQSGYVFHLSLVVSVGSRNCGHFLKLQGTDCVDHLKSLSASTTNEPISTTNKPKRTFLKCLTCNDVDTVDACIEERACAPGQFCFLDKYSVFVRDFEGNDKEIFKYNAGCRSTSICHITQCKEKESGFSYNGSNHTLRSKRAITPIHCTQCCKTDRCNLDLCDFKSTGSDAVRCYSCSDIRHPKDCKDVIFCQPNEKCLITREIRINPDDSLSPVYQQRCERKQLCKAVHEHNIIPTTTTTTVATTTEEPHNTTISTTIPTTTTTTKVVELTPPPSIFRSLARYRRSHNLIQIGAECCDDDYCNTFEIGGPVHTPEELISLPDSYVCPTTTTPFINFTLPMTTTTTTLPTTESTTPKPTTPLKSTPSTKTTITTTATTASTSSTTSTTTSTPATTPTTVPTTTASTTSTELTTESQTTSTTQTTVTSPPPIPSTETSTVTTTLTTATTKPTTTTTIPTTTTTPTTTPTTTTTTPTTTTTTPTTTTTTPTTTTTTPTTTTPKAPTSCYLCNGMPIYICEQFSTPLQCDTSDQQYCLNILVNNRDGSRTLDRKCATKDECKTKWWDQTSDRQECSGYDPTSYTAQYFTCTFCCSSSQCNKNIVPDNLYVPDQQ
ncbi:mucin-2-like [Saccostrea echinata]|uniref:mucin-2-like n=1 Tax=Saccostrea echinata TaxID=191078 RepID=UPI002A8095CC|nr:mucin-2-like [Saccostrea echinata]